MVKSYYKPKILLYCFYLHLIVRMKNSFNQTRFVPFVKMTVSYINNEYFVDLRKLNIRIDLVQTLICQWRINSDILKVTVI